MNAQSRLDALPVTMVTLASIPRWVAWQHEERDPGKPPTKVPYDPNSDRKAKANDPNTWGTRDAAESRASCLPLPFDVGGVGFELGDLGDGWCLGGVDLDTCRAPDGAITPWANEVVDRFASYTETSPSGTGVKVYFRYSADDLTAIRAAMGTDHGKTWKPRSESDHPPAIELHLSNRYFAVTDQHMAGTPLEVCPVTLATLLWLIREHGPAFAVKARIAGTHEAVDGGDGSGDLRQRIAGAARSSPVLARRWAGYWDGLVDQSRSGRAFALGGALKRAGFTREEMEEVLALHPDTSGWADEKGTTAGGRELDRIWDRTSDSPQRGCPDPDMLAHPDMSVLRLNRRPPPELPLDVFGPEWRKWIEGAAAAAACPADYVAGPLLASASALIGNARWAEGNPGWAEPPHLWVCAVGDSGSGKSPGADCLLRDVLPEIERRMVGDFPDRHRDWQAAAERAKASDEHWKDAVRKAQKNGTPPPSLPTETVPPEPQQPRLRQHDVTIEKVAALLTSAAPKGLLVVRDECAGWFQGMNAYNDAGRSFWIEAYGGRPYRVERVKHSQPIEVLRLAVAVTGGTQPDKLAEMMRQADDGLLARMCWCWPDPVPFKLSRAAPRTDWAIAALDRLRELELISGAMPGEPSRPLHVPLTDTARKALEAFGREMQGRQQEAGGLMRSALGKARGTALRLASVIEYLWWCGSGGTAPSPTQITEAAFAAAAGFVRDYWMPMAERVYGDASASPIDRNAATLARWLVKTRPTELHVRHLQRDVRLPGLTDAASIHAAAHALMEAGWLTIREGIGAPGRPKAVYIVNPRVWEAMP